MLSYLFDLFSFILFYYCSMNRYKIYGGTPQKTSRLKTDYFVTHDNSKFTESSLASAARQYTDRSYYDIAISKSKISQRQGYLSRRKKQLSQRQQSTQKPQKKRLLVFKNLQQFDIQLKIQHGKFDSVQNQMSAFGISTYKGTNKSINTHQIAVHVGQLTALSLIEGYDGLFAANQLKKHFSNQLLLGFKSKKINHRQQPFRIAENTIKKALENSKKRLKKAQEQRGDNSGASFLSLVIHKNVVFTMNCGSGEAICMTKNGRLIKLAKPHTTSNDNQVERIVKEGGQLYQTIVNIPFRKDMHVTGPLRVYPEGLTVTRTLGKSLNKHRRVQTVSNAALTKGVLSQPQLQFIPTSQVRWVAVVSSRIAEIISSQRVRDIIQQQLKRRSTEDLSTEIAEHCCKRLILEAVEAGQANSLSALLILGCLQTPSTPIKNPQKQEQKQVYTTPNKLNREPRSLKYIGNRANFVQIQSQF